MPKGGAATATATMTETVSGKVAKKGNKRHEKKQKEEEAAKKPKKYFRVFSGNPAEALLRGNGITSIDRHGRQCLDSAATTFLQDLAIASLIAKNIKPGRKTISGNDVRRAARIHCNIDLLRDSKREKARAKLIKNRKVSE